MLSVLTEERMCEWELQTKDTERIVWEFSCIDVTIEQLMCLFRN